MAGVIIVHEWFLAEPYHNHVAELPGLGDRSLGWPDKREHVNGSRGSDAAGTQVPTGNPRIASQAQLLIGPLPCSPEIGMALARQE